MICVFYCSLGDDYDPRFWADDDYCDWTDDDCFDWSDDDCVDGTNDDCVDGTNEDCCNWTDDHDDEDRLMVWGVLQKEGLTTVR